MTLTRARFIRLVKASVLALIALAVVGYAVWRSLAYVQGPKIIVFQPLSGTTVSSTTVDVSGMAERVNSLSLNGYPISVDEKGGFDEKLVVFPGVNILTLSATDRFGRRTTDEIVVFGAAQFPDTASTTVR